MTTHEEFTMNARTSTGTGRRRYQRCLAALAVLAVGFSALQVIAAGPVSAAPGDITEFPLSGHRGLLGIAAGRDGNLWFTEAGVGRIGRITPTGTITEYASGITPDSVPDGIVAGPDGNLWFTEQSGRIGRITPTGAVTEYGAGITPDSAPRGITAGPDGNLWFTEDSGRIGRITPTGTVTEYTTGIASGSVPYGITAGRDGNLWFTEYNADRIGRITPTGTVTEYATSSNSGPEGITSGPDGNLWFTEYRGDRIGQVITDDGTVTEFAVGITADSGPTGIATGPDGNLWFTESNADRIGRITPTGTVTEYATGITPDSAPDGITTGPDGNIWFTESTAERIARLELAEPQASLSPASHDFGEQPLGSTSGPQQFTLTNTGTTRLTVGDVSISGADPGDFAISDDHCSGVAIRPAVHNTCTINVTFAPTAIGPRSATLTIPDNAPGSPHTAALSGAGSRAASAVQLSASPNPSTFGDPVTLTAHVSTAAPVTPTGSVAFTDGATSLGTAAVDGTGTATLTTTTLHGGQRQITATYSGDTNLLTSSTTTAQQVNPAATTLTAHPAQLVVQLPGTSGLRLSARLALTRTGAPITGQPVSMRVNGTTACTATTAANGVATCTAPLIYLLGVTLHGYTATYPGTPDYQPTTGHAGLLA